MSIFHPQRQPLIGLDIGAHSLNWVELAPAGRAQLRLVCCAAEPLPSGCIVAGHIERFDDVAAALQRLVRSVGSRCQRVALAMPAEHLQLRQLMLPGQLSPAELALQVSAEVRQHSGQPLHELALDYGVLPPTPGSGLDASRVAWIATAPSDMLQDRLGLAESIGLRPVIVEGEAQARARAARRLLPLGSGQDPAGPERHAAVWALIHVEAGMASWQCMRGDTLLQQGQTAWSDSGAVAKQAQALLADVLRGPEAPALSRLTWVMLAGGQAHSAGLAEALARAADCACLLADPLAAVQGGHAAVGSDVSVQTRARLMTACGLALRRFATAC